MGLKNILLKGTLVLTLLITSCGSGAGGSGGGITYTPTEAKAYIKSELEKDVDGRRYTVTDNIFASFKNNYTGVYVPNVFDLYANKAGDEQFWEIDDQTIELKEMRDSQIGSPPDIGIPENLDKATLDLMIEGFCTN